MVRYGCGIRGRIKKNCSTGEDHRPFPAVADALDLDKLRGFALPFDDLPQHGLLIHATSLSLDAALGFRRGLQVPGHSCTLYSWNLSLSCFHFKGLRVHSQNHNCFVNIQKRLEGKRGSRRTLEMWQTA